MNKPKANTIANTHRQPPSQPKMTTPLQITIPNNKLSIPKDKRAFLTYPADGLTHCALEELEDGVCLTFGTDGLEPSKQILSMPRAEQLRFLINCADLERLYSEYDFSLSTDNLLIDINLRPKVLLRDAAMSVSGFGYSATGNSNGIGSVNGNSLRSANGNAADNGNTATTNPLFLPRYKALIGSLLQSKYTYDDFDKGGTDLFKKNKLTLEISEMETIADIKECLLKEYHKTIRDIKLNQRLVPRQNMLIARIVIPVLIIALLTTGFFTGRSLLFDLPHYNQVIAANEAYIAGNHLAVQQALSGISIDNLSHETRHILSRSFVATEPISIAQRDNILMGLTLMTDTTIFDYWIHIGRLEFYEAIDIAQRFGDNELLLFAYLRYEAIVIADPHMPGGEKVTLLAYIERQIDALQRERDGVVVDDDVTGENDYGYDYDEPANGHADDGNEDGVEDGIEDSNGETSNADGEENGFGNDYETDDDNDYETDDDDDE